MEAMAGRPGNPGSTQDGRYAGGHVRRLIALAEALTRSAAAPGACAPAAGRRLTAPLGMDMGSLSDAQAVSWAQELEHLGAFLAALQVQAAGDLAGRVRAGRFDGVKLPTDLFGTSLKLGRSEAGRRLRLAGKFLPATDELTLATNPAAQPVAAAAFFAGELSVERALTASRYTEEARHLADGGRITAQTASEVEETLTGYARAMDPDSLARVGLRVVNVLDPDGQQPTEGGTAGQTGHHLPPATPRPGPLRRLGHRAPIRDLDGRHRIRRQPPPTHRPQHRPRHRRQRRPRHQRRSRRRWSQDGRRDTGHRREPRIRQRRQPRIPPGRR
ncbi:DUF222 domain-containing protein [Arthrobacter sp.]|uniref:DUF222 domain-containing protein n=1 Tax=Arthrobacter sp. TaxID=1667 RepID=UPI00258EE411|nr:DUF222 domain-containing protein [Arthrobacter sp.]